LAFFTWVRFAARPPSQQERAPLAAWMIEQDYDEWGMEMARNFSPGGRGHQIADDFVVT
jgi:hypothetical protein